MKKSFEAGHSERLLHTLVILGAALATACGGGLNDADDSSTGAGGAGDAAGGSSSGGAPAAGGTASSGVDVGTGGTIDLGPVPPDSYACPPAQWDCAPENIDFAYPGVRLVDPASCNCEPARPAAVGDCEPTEDFVCLSWTMREDYREFTTPVLLQCSCQARTEECWTACDYLETPGTGRYFDELGGCSPDEMSPRAILCGYAPVVLK